MIDTRRLYRRASRYYDILDWPFEVLRYRALRPRLFAGLRGQLLDLGAGTGRNAASYPSQARVCAIDLSEAMLRKAQARIRRTNARASCVVANAKQLPLPNASVDTCISTFLFCVMPDEQQETALREIRRTLKDDGRLILLEYVYSRAPWRRLWMKTLAPLVEYLYGARFDRQTRKHLANAGFRLDHEEFVAGDVLLLLEASPTPGPAPGTPGGAMPAHQ